MYIDCVTAANFSEAEVRRQSAASAIDAYTRLVPRIQALSSDVPVPVCTCGSSPSSGSVPKIHFYGEKDSCVSCSVPENRSPKKLPIAPWSNLSTIEYGHEPISQEVFQRIVSTYLRFTKPVFGMNGNVRLGEPFGLHFFEPRYRILIAQATEDFPPEARQGEPILANANGDFPTFVYAHVAPFAPTKPACLVQVRQCHIHPDGTADVMLVPVAYVWLEQLWERPNTGHLYYAQCLRMGQDATRQMENRAFRASERRQFADFLSNHHLGEEQHGIIQELLGFVLARDQYNLPGRDDGEDMETGDA